MKNVGVNSSGAHLFVFKAENHNGFTLMTKLELHSFNDRPTELWDSDMLEPFELKKINKKIRTDPTVLAMAKSKAAEETKVPEPTNQP